MKLLSSGLGSLAIAGTVFVAASTSMQPGHWIASLGATSTDNAYVQGDLTPISPQISGNIVEIAVRDNQSVHAGDVLFRIDDRDYQARVDQAASGVAARRAAVGSLESQIRLQQALIEQAVAALSGAEAEADQASRDFTRQTSLVGRGWVAQAKLDQAEASHLQARSLVAKASANLDAARRQLDVLKAQRPKLQADVNAAVAAERLAEIDLERTVVRAPADGWLGERHAKVGQYVRPGTLLAALVPSDMWIVANFKETQIPAIRNGDRVTVSVDSVPGTEFNGHVDSLSPASGAEFAVLPPDNATGNFTRIVQRIPVKITFDPGQSDLDRLRLGMSAVVHVEGASDTKALADSSN